MKKQITKYDYETIEQIVQKVRYELSQKYDVIHGNYKKFQGHKNYQGLCDEACMMVKEYLEKEFKYANIRFEIIHGEQRHSTKYDSEYWSYQHTWMCMIKDYQKIYIDPTAGQFHFIHQDIPEYYISTKKPKWYYPDRENPAWRGITKYINRKILVERPVFYGEYNYQIVKDGFIEFCQYGLWGTLSDMIRERRIRKRWRKSK